MISNNVKLVIWDLDETFWKGTLSEEGISLESTRVREVVELARRGIVSSICSKNDPEAARKALEALGCWEYFVCPKISWSSKGPVVAQLIEQMALRPENCLFIDDNALNLEEVRFFSPSIMTALPDILDGLLDHPRLTGKPDPTLSRLKQYQVLQRKQNDQSESRLSKEDFLRTSGITIVYDYDVLKNIDRVVDLLNRSNQLNYTKSRLATPESVEDFKNMLGEYGISACCIWARDHYGDYGLIGFYMLKTTYRSRDMLHFVFSCRTMHMGIEQYVYAKLGRPSVTVVEPVSCPIENFTSVDWISEGGMDAAGKPVAQRVDKCLVLVGGCDLLQLGTYLSTRRTEFVNAPHPHDAAIQVRYDDPAFFTADRQHLCREAWLDRLFTWTSTEALALDAALAEAEVVLLSLWWAMHGAYLSLNASLDIRVQHATLELYQRNHPEWFKGQLAVRTVNDNERLERILQAMDAASRRAHPRAKIFLFGTNTRGTLPAGEDGRRKRFNEFTRSYTKKRPDRFTYVDVDALVPSCELVDPDHFTRMGYLAISQHVANAFQAREMTG